MAEAFFCYSTTKTTTLKTKKGFEEKKIYSEKFSSLNHSKITDKNFNKQQQKLGRKRRRTLR